MSTVFKLFSFSLIAFILLGCGCDLDQNSHDGQKIMVMTYNVQNLFDPYIDGNEYPEFTPEGGWTNAKYRQRLKTISQAITQGHNLVPSIVLLQEVEHIGVVQDLVESHLKRYQLSHYAATANQDSPIQVGVISKYPIVEMRTHIAQGIRPVLETHLYVHQEKLVIFTLHAKSRLGGVQETESLRLKTAQVIQQRVQELLKSNPFLAIIVAGDFNGSVDSILKEGDHYDHALVPASSPHASSAKHTGAFIITGEVPLSGEWYSWYLDRKESLIADAPGSCYYNGVWESFDNLLLSPAFFDRIGLEFDRSYIGAFEPLIDAKKRPNTYNPTTGKGVSDHLPVGVILKGL
ncbi:MAG: endonuclease/exonuclease/phosphatase family protein [Sphaerochaetaceae bacterium]|jgi:endonuclease/exonuclease/phosphatase family metal-dependent hydrolase